MTRRLTCVLAVWLGAVVVLAAAGVDVRVSPVVDRGRLFASFSAPDAFTPAAEAVMDNGLLLTFSYTVELRRPAPVWFDETLARVDVAASVKHDLLTGAYQVSKLRDGRVVWSEQTQDAAEARTWMTEFERVPIEPAVALEPNVDYYLRVRLQANPRARFSLWSLFPWADDDGAGRGVFTFLR